MDNVLDLIKDKATAAVSFTDIETAVVKACSRQLIAPKPKHIKTLLIHCNNRIAPMSDIFKTLDSVLKEPHWAVVFKALITIHVLSRDACGDRILGYIAAQPNILNLSGFKDKTNTPAGVEQAKNIRSYASYLEEKVASFRDLKCDYCRDSGDLARALHAKSPGSELFRHTKTLVRLSNSLLSCKFYLDELDNPITMDAFRYLLRDLMAIYRALAKGCLKLLETYFDMSKGDATEALEIYQSYAQVNEKVIDFFKIAKRVESALSSDIPDITPTPASLTDTLKQYLDNYEENHRTNNSSSNQGNNSQSNQKTQAERVSISANTNNLNNNNNNNNLLDLFDVSSTSGNNANSNNYNNQAIVSNAFDPFQVSNNRNFGSFSGPQGISAGNKDPFAITAAGQSQAPFSSSAMMSNSFSNPFQQQQMQQPIQHQMQQQIQQPIQQQMHQPIQHQIHQQMQQPMQQYNFQKQTSYQQPNPFQSQHNPTVIPPSSYNSMGSSFSTTAPLPVTQVQPRNIQTDAFGDLFQQQGQNNQGFAKPFYQPQPQFNNNNVNPFTNSIQPNATNFGGSSNPFTSTSVAQPFPSNPIRNNNANTSNSNNRNNAVSIL